MRPWPPKRIDERLETRGAGFRRGTEVLTEKGFSATGLDEVLQADQRAQGFLHHYFDSKGSLWLEMADPGRGAALRLDRWFDDQSHWPRYAAAFVETQKRGIARHAYRRNLPDQRLWGRNERAARSYHRSAQAVFQDWQAGSRPAHGGNRAGEIAPDAGAGASRPSGSAGRARYAGARLMRGAAPSTFRAAIHQRSHALIFRPPITGGLKGGSTCSRYS